ncbi:MAG: hypothetical protein ACRDXX_12265 [Stackebrandtia sp.]
MPKLSSRAARRAGVVVAGLIAAVALSMSPAAAFADTVAEDEDTRCGFYVDDSNAGFWGNCTGAEELIEIQQYGSGIVRKRCTEPGVNHIISFYYGETVRSTGETC